MLKNTPAMYKKAYPFLKEVDSLALANVQLHLEKAYKNFFRDPKVGFPVESRTGLYSSDSTPFADQGVPALSFARDASRNVAPIHCRYDLKEVLSMEQLQKDINFLTTFTKRFANAAICPVSRTIPEKIRKELDEYLYRKRKEA